MTETVEKKQKHVTQGDIVAQSTEMLEVISAGGIVILPLDVAYAIVGNSEQAIRGIFTAKHLLERHLGDLGCGVPPRDLHRRHGDGALAVLADAGGLVRGQGAEGDGLVEL